MAFIHRQIQYNAHHVQVDRNALLPQLLLVLLDTIPLVRPPHAPNVKPDINALNHITLLFNAHQVSIVWLEQQRVLYALQEVNAQQLTQ